MAMDILGYTRMNVCSQDYRFYYIWLSHCGLYTRLNIPVYSIAASENIPAQCLPTDTNSSTNYSIGPPLIPVEIVFKFWFGTYKENSTDVCSLGSVSGMRGKNRNIVLGPKHDTFGKLQYPDFTSILQSRVTGEHLRKYVC